MRSALIKTACVLAVLIALSPAIVLGDFVVADYRFGDAGGSSTASVDTHSSAASNWAPHSAIQTGTIYRDSPTDDYVVLQRCTHIGGSDSEATSVTNNAYWNFTLTPDDALTLTRLEFDRLYYNADPVGTIFVRTDAGGDNFTTTLISVDVTSNSRVATSVDLSTTGVDFSNITSPVEFRFYLYTQNHSNQGQTHGVDNVVLHATPEPATCLLAGLSLLGGLLMRRKRA